MKNLFQKYSRKPEEIEAVELTENNADEIMNEINASSPENGFECERIDRSTDLRLQGYKLVINDGENDMLAKIGDMIVREGPLPWYTPWKKEKFEEIYG